MHKFVINKTVWVLILIFLLSPFTFYTQWDFINHKGVLIYGTRTSLLSYFEVGNNTVGYEYQLLNDFAKLHSLKLETRVYKNNRDLLNDLSAGKIDIAGGHLSMTKERSKRFAYSDAISETAIDLVTHFDHRNGDSIEAFEPLNGQVIADSSYEELLHELTNFQPVQIAKSVDDSLFDLFRKVNKKEIDYTFADSEITHIYKHFIPGIYQTIQLSPKESIVFLVDKNRQETFLSKLNQFIQFAAETKKIKDYKTEILNHLPQIDIADTVTFFDKLQTQWPKVKDDVKAVANALDFDAALLAAISYQESHWDPDAVSITGVKGLMMLTESTAEEMNVSDRTDPFESLMGGVKYLRKVKSKMPARITEPDRTLFALAAYNVGFGHLEDARILAQKAGHSPDFWTDVEPFLEMLNNPALGHELNYGTADGKTAVIYVNNIITYKQLMTWRIQKDDVEDDSESFL